MSALHDPKDRSFLEPFSTVDRAQMAMLCDLASADARLILQGGMAMRIVVGSMRLTKDVALDQVADMSTNAVKASVRKALVFGGQWARLLGAQVHALKATPTTVRMRLAGVAAGAPVKFVVEVSGRPAPPAGDLTSSKPVASYTAEPRWLMDCVRQAESGNLIKEKITCSVP